MTKSKVMIDNFKTRVTEWIFKPGEETGQHIHEYDYVVVPMSDGVLKIINEDCSITFSELKILVFSQIFIKLTFFLICIDCSSC